MELLVMRNTVYFVLCSREIFPWPPEPLRPRDEAYCKDAFDAFVFETLKLLRTATNLGFPLSPRLQEFRDTGEPLLAGTNWRDNISLNPTKPAR
jgi:hypothetical protein